MRKLTWVLTTFLLIWSAQGLAALGSPQPQLLWKELAAAIPPYWTVTGVKITASVNIGNAVEPNVKQRFEAVVKPVGTLYVKEVGAAHAFAPYTPIVPTIKADTTRTLYGIAESTYDAGQWNTKFELENSVVSLGVPRSMFSTPTVIRGTKEAAEIQEMLRPDLAQRIKRKLQAQIEQLKAEQQAEIRSLEATHAKALDQTKASYAAEQRKLDHEQQKVASAGKTKVQELKSAQKAEIEQLKVAHQVALKNLRTKQDAQLARLREEHANAKGKLQAQIEQLKAEQQAEIRSLEATHAKAMDQIKASYAAEQRKLDHEQQKVISAGKAKVQELKSAQKAEIEQLKVAHQVALKNLRAKQDAQLARLREEHANELVSLKQKHEQKLAVINAKYDQQVETLKLEIQRTSQLIALQKKKMEKEAALAETRKEAFKARQMRNQAQLANYRKALASKDADIRRSAFDAALNSDKQILTRTAIRTASKSADPVLRKKALQLALASGDATLRLMAINAALASGVPRLQSEALLAIFSEEHTISGIATPKGKEGDDQPITLQDIAYNPKNGKVSTEVRTGIDYCDGHYEGGLSGASLLLYYGDNCYIRIAWEKSSVMTGIVQIQGKYYAGSVKTYRVELSL